MKLFWRIKRVKGLLWVHMYSDCKYPYFAACQVIENRSEARAAFAQFVKELSDGND